jgi:hypothetical protein
MREYHEASTVRQTLSSRTSWLLLKDSSNPSDSTNSLMIVTAHSAAAFDPTSLRKCLEPPCPSDTAAIASSSDS